LDTTSGEVGNFKLDVDGPLGFALPGAAHAASEASGHASAVLVIALDGRQAEFGAHEELLPSTELLDLPDDR
jgi:hypothetical protein